jgi:hypothetical protein
MSLHTEILSAAQQALLPKLEYFADDYYLVGGTALALQIGHRQSIDFDFFTANSFDNQRLLTWTQRNFGVSQVKVNQVGQLTLTTSNDVQLTWYQYEWLVSHQVSGPANLTMPDSLGIACMKAFALGHRAKWKDYVDMYFLLKQFSLSQIVVKTTEIFGPGLFDEALLRGQLSYFADIDCTEVVTFMPGFEVEQEEIKKFLSEVAIS